MCDTRTRNDWSRNVQGNKLNDNLMHFAYIDIGTCIAWQNHPNEGPTIEILSFCVTWANGVLCLIPIIDMQTAQSHVRLQIHIIHCDWITQFRFGWHVAWHCYLTRGYLVTVMYVNPIARLNSSAATHKTIFVPDTMSFVTPLGNNISRLLRRKSRRNTGKPPNETRRIQNPIKYSIKMKLYLSRSRLHQFRI